MTEILEIGKISSRGQIAIPTDIRTEMGLETGSKIIFFLEEDTLLIKKVNTRTWEEVTRPLRLAKKKVTENEVDELVHRLRKK